MQIDRKKHFRTYHPEVKSNLEVYIRQLLLPKNRTPRSDSKSLEHLIP